MEKGRVLHLNKLESPSSNDALCQVWLKLAQLSREEDFFNLSMYFRNFVIISPWKRRGPSFVNTRIPFTQGCFVACLVEIGSVVLEKKIFKICQCIFAICNYIPLEKGTGLHLNKLKFPSPNDALCQVRLKLAHWFLRRRFLKFVNVFSQFCNYLLLKKGTGLHLNKLDPPTPNDD